MIQFDEIPGIGGISAVGIKLLVLMLTIDLCREALRMVRGRPADFGAVAIRGAIAGVIIGVIPTAALQLAKFSTGLFALMSGISDAALLNNSFKAAVGNFGCTIGGWEAVGLLFSKAGLLIVASQLVMLLVMIVKTFVIDIMWPVMFALTVYMGILTVPISMLPELGGIWHYVRRVVSVAMWPVTFGFLMMLVSASFPKTLQAVTDGDIRVTCAQLREMSEDNPLGPVARKEAMFFGATASDLAKPDDYKGLINYLGICLAIVLLTLKTPSLCSAMFGDPSGGLVAQLGSTVSGAAKSLVGGPVAGVTKMMKGGK